MVKGRGEEHQGDSERVIITAEEIKNMNVRSIVELLNQTPGVNAGKQTVSIRGSHIVRVLLDGRPINDLLSAHRVVKWDIVSLENIERIEIHKGGGGAAFGDDTSGGVISITTKRVKGPRAVSRPLPGTLIPATTVWIIGRRSLPLGLDCLPGGIRPTVSG